jgi:MFS family permease
MLVAGTLGLLTVGDGFIYLTLFSHGTFAAEWFPLLYVGTNVAYLVAAVPLGRLADGWGRARVFVLGHAALVLAYLCASVTGWGIAPLLGCLVLLGLFYAATDGVLAALAGQHAPEGATASAIAAAQTVVAVARLAASSGFGVLWIVFGAATSMVAAAVGLGLAMSGAIFLLARRPKAAAPSQDAR